MPLTASCHCGATTIALNTEPTEAHSCNCSYCQRAGALWAEIKPDDMVFLSNSAEGTYNPSGLNVHHFCTNCGMQTWGDSPNWSELYNNDGTLKPGAVDGVPQSRSTQINLNLVDGLDRSTLTITAMDGRNNW